MANSSPYRDFLPFEAFLDLLREHGFAIGVSEQLRLRLLLEKLPSGTNQRALRSLMCPLFARNPQDQRLFYRLYDYHFAELLPGDAAETPTRQRAEALEPTRKPWLFPRYGRGVFIALGLVVASVLGWLTWDGFQAYRKSESYLQAFYLPETLSNKLSYTAREVFGLSPLCGDLRADFGFRGSLASRGRWEVRFDNRSAGSPNRYTWDFGGIARSDQMNPVELLPPGEITVCLTAYGRRGCRQVRCKTVALGPTPGASGEEVAPEAYFTYRQDGTSTDVIFRDSSVLGGRENVRFRWLFGDGKEGYGQTVRHRYTAYGSYTVRLQLLDNGNVPLDRTAIRIRVDDPNQLTTPPAPAAPLHLTRIRDLYCSAWQRYATPIKWILFLAILSGFASFVLYRENKKMVARRSPGPSRGPYTYRLNTPGGFELYDQQLLRDTARQLRRRRENGGSVFDIPATVEATVAEGGYPSLRYRSGSQPAEYLVLIDRVCSRDHQARFFSYLCEVLSQEDILLDIYYFQRNPDLFWKQPDSLPVTASELSALYPNHRLVILGDAQHFIDGVQGDLTESAYELLQWEDRAILSPASTADWGYRESMLARHFRFLPAGIEALKGLVDQFRRDEPRPLRSWLRPAEQSVPLREDDTYPPQEAQVTALRRYLGEEPFRWLACCALYPELQWEMTTHIARKLYETDRVKKPLLTEDHLLNLCRLAFFRKGAIPDSLRLALTQTLEEADEQVARQAICEVIESAEPPRNSVAAYEHRKQWALQQWELKTRSGKPRRALSVELEDMLRRGEVQDPVALHYLQTRKARPLDYVMPPRIRKLIYPRGISLLGAKARLIGLAALPLLAGLLWYQPPSPRQIVETEGGAYVCLQSQADSARYLDYQGCQAYLKGKDDDQQFVVAYNYFNDAVGKNPGDSHLARMLYHRGLAALEVHGSRNDPTFLRQAQEDFRQAVGLLPRPERSESVTHLTVREAEESTSQTFERIGPDGTAVLRVREGGLSLGSLDATLAVELASGVEQAIFIPGLVTRLGVASEGRDVRILDGRGRTLARLPANLHQDAIRSLRASPSGNLLVTTSDDRTAVVWDLGEGKTLNRSSEHRAPVLDASFSPDEAFLVTAGADGVAILTEVQTGIRLAVMVGHRGRVHSVDVHPLGGLIMTAGADSTIRFWDYDGQQLRLLPVQEGVVSAAFSRLGDYLLMIDGKGNLTALKVAGGFLRSLEPPVPPGEKRRLPGPFRALSQSSTGDAWLASFALEATLYRMAPASPLDSLLLDSYLAFQLAAYEDRHFGEAETGLSKLITLQPTHYKALLVRAWSRLFQIETAGTTRSASRSRGLEDLEIVQARAPELLAASQPETWVPDLLNTLKAQDLRERLCKIVPDACEVSASEPTEPSTLPPVTTTLFDSILGAGYDGMYRASKDGKVGFIKAVGTEYVVMVPFLYEDAFDFSNELAAVRLAGKWGFVDREGRQVIAPRFDRIISRPREVNVVACVEEGVRQFCIDRQGECQSFREYRCEEVRQPKATTDLIPKTPVQAQPRETATGYLFTGPFSEGLAPVRKGDRFGYVNQAEEVMIPLEFDQAGPFYNGRARVSRNGKSYFIDVEGNCIPTAGTECPE